MIDELIASVSYFDKVAKGVAYQSMLLPDPATKTETMSGRSGARIKNHTIAAGP
jgi:hypothetical protein